MQVFIATPEELSSMTQKDIREYQQSLARAATELRAAVNASQEAMIKKVDGG